MSNIEACYSWAESTHGDLQQPAMLLLMDCLLHTDLGAPSFKLPSQGHANAAPTLEHKHGAA